MRIRGGRNHRRNRRERVDLIFTDLDGTLLDPQTYQWAAARPALRALERRRIPLILVTSKTAAEVWPLLKALGRREPFIVENGGAIFFPSHYFPFRVEGSAKARPGWREVILGTPRARLVKTLAQCARQAGVAIRGFSGMSTREVAKLTGLEPGAAARARRRAYDEPFVIEDRDPRAWPRLRAEIRRRGLKAIRGSRLFHVLGSSDKGTAVRLLTGWYRRMNGQRPATVGLGDSPNDIPMLRAVTLPVLVARPGGHYDSETFAAVPHAQNGQGIGPMGWNEAVLRLLKV